MKRLLFVVLLISLVLGSCVFVFDPWTKGTRIDGSLYWSDLAVAVDGNVYFYNSRGNLFELSPEGEIISIYSLGEGEWFYCGPSIDDSGELYVGTTKGRLLKISPEGELIWYFDSEESDSSARGGPSIGSDGRVYFGTTGGILFCLDGETGEMIWSIDIGRAIWSKPAITADGTIYFGTLSGNVEKQLFYAVKEGEVLWTFETEEESTGFYSSPAIGANGVVYTGCHDGFLYALSKEGVLLWNLKITSEDESAIASSPVIGPDGTIYIATQSGYAISVSSSETEADVLWSRNLDTRISATPLIASDNVIYVVGEYGATLYTLDGNNEGAIISETSAGRSTISSPVMSANGTIYFGANLNDIGSSSIVFSLETDSSPAGLWPMFGRDAQRTSRAD